MIDEHEMTVAEAEQILDRATAKIEGIAKSLQRAATNLDGIAEKAKTHAEAIAFVKLVADMSMAGDEGYELDVDDCVDTLTSLIAKARRLALRRAAAHASGAPTRPSVPGWVRIDVGGLRDQDFVIMPVGSEAWYLPEGNGYAESYLTGDAARQASDDHDAAIDLASSEG